MFKNPLWLCRDKMGSQSKFKRLFFFFQGKNGNHKLFYLSFILKNTYRRSSSTVIVLTTDHSPLNTIEIDSSLCGRYWSLIHQTGLPKINLFPHTSLFKAISKSNERSILSFQCKEIKLGWWSFFLNGSEEREGDRWMAGLNFIFWSWLRINWMCTKKIE